MIRLTLGSTLSTHWIGGRVGPRTGLDAVDQRKKFVTKMKLNSDSRVRNL
jgi:hypothetical protein